MKKYVIIFLALLFALSSCDSDLRRAKRYYHQAQEVAESDPDSALILIDSVLNIRVFLDDDIRMNMSLMQSKAIFTHPDGERRELSSRIKAKKIYTMPELERAADYYGAKEDYYKAAYAALYSGYVLRELRADDEAMVFFKDAVKYTELTSDSLAFARASYNVAKLLYQKFLNEEALPVIKSADAYFGTQYDERALALNLIGCIKVNSLSFDEAENCFKQSIVYSQLSNSQIAYKKAMGNLSVCYREQGRYDDAINCVRQIKAGTDTIRLFLNNMNFGKLYTCRKQYDSAAYYFNKVIDLLPVAKLKDDNVASAYNGLSKFEEARGNYKSALSYKQKQLVLHDKIHTQLREDNLYHINKKYDYEALQNDMNRRIISNYRIEIAMASVIIVVLAVAFALYYRIVQKNKKEAEIKATLMRVLNDNEALIRDKSETISEKLRSMQRLEILTKDQKDKYLLSNLEKEMFGDKNHWEVMTDLFNTIYPGLYDTLKEKHPDLSELERRVYMLSNFNLSRLDEALLLDVSTSVLDKARGKVKKLQEQENLFTAVISTEV